MSWARLDLNLQIIFIETNDFRDAGVYYLVLHVDANGESTATPVQVVYLVTINACTNAEVVITGDIADFDYSTSQGPVTIQTIFASSIPGCSLNFDFTALELTSRPFFSGIFELDG